MGFHGFSIAFGSFLTEKGLDTRKISINESFPSGPVKIEQLEPCR
jgi:hypothetical protein